VIPAPLAPPPAAPPPPAPRTGGVARPGEYGPAAPYSADPPPGYPDNAGWNPSGGRGGYPPSRRGGNRPMFTRLAIVLVVLLVLAAIGTGVYSLSRPHGGGAAAAGRSGGGSASPSVAANTVLTPASAEGYDALGLANDQGDEDNAGAKFAIDGNPSTAWHTQFYEGSPIFGNLKKGTGLLVDMGKTVSLRSVQITFGPEAGANVGHHGGQQQHHLPRRACLVYPGGQAQAPGRGYPDLPDQQLGQGPVCADLVHQAAPAARQHFRVPGLHLQPPRAGIGLSRARAARAGMA